MTFPLSYKHLKKLIHIYCTEEKREKMGAIPKVAGFPMPVAVFIVAYQGSHSAFCFQLNDVGFLCTGTFFLFFW